MIFFFGSFSFKNVFWPFAGFSYLNLHPRSNRFYPTFVALNFPIFSKWNLAISKKTFHLVETRNLGIENRKMRKKTNFGRTLHLFDYSSYLIILIKTLTRCPNLCKFLDDAAIFCEQKKCLFSLQLEFLH